MRQWYGYAARMPAPKRASSPLCVVPTTFETSKDRYLTVYCNGRLHHDGPHYAVGLGIVDRYLLAEWDD